MKKQPKKINVEQDYVFELLDKNFFVLKPLKFTPEKFKYLARKKK